MRYRSSSHTLKPLDKVIIQGYKSTIEATTLRHLTINPRCDHSTIPTLLHLTLTIIALTLKLLSWYGLLYDYPPTIYAIDHIALCHV